MLKVKNGIKKERRLRSVRSGDPGAGAGVEFTLRDGASHSL